MTDAPLMPCPFCAHTNIVWKSARYIDGPNLAHCSHCGAETHWDWWNRRPDITEAEVERAAIAFVGAALRDPELRDLYPWDRPPWPADTKGDAIRLLEKAGALIAAEIDRRLREEARDDAR